MDSFYAHTDTFVEVPLAALLSPGTYSVRLTLDDPTQDVHASNDAIPFTVEAPAVVIPGVGVVPALTPVVQSTPDGGGVPLPVWVVVLLGGLGICLLVVGFFVGLWRRRRTVRPE
jgi:hypothetical protein